MSNRPYSEQSFKIPTGASTSGWEGKAAYQSGDNEAQPISDADVQIPVGVIIDVDPDSGYLRVCDFGWVPGGILMGETVDLSGQRVENGDWGCSNDSGEGVGAVNGNFRLGRFDSHGGDPADTKRHPFFVHIDGSKLVVA